MKDIKISGDNNGSINNFENAVISNVNIGSPIDSNTTTFNKQKTTIGQVEATISFVVSGFSAFRCYDYSKSPISITTDFLPLLFLGMLFALCIVNGAVALFVILNSAFKLKRKGSITTIGSFPTITNLFPNGTVKSVYINDDGDIYKLKGCECPLCETNPKGFMSFTYSKTARAFELKCNRNNQHCIPFDHTKKIQ